MSMVPFTLMVRANIFVNTTTTPPSIVVLISFRQWLIRDYFQLQVILLVSTPINQEPSPPKPSPSPSPQSTGTTHQRLPPSPAPPLPTSRAPRPSPSLPLTQTPSQEETRYVMVSTGTTMARSTNTSPPQALSPLVLRNQPPTRCPSPATSTISKPAPKTIVAASHTGLHTLSPSTRP